MVKVNLPPLISRYPQDAWDLFQGRFQPERIHKMQTSASQRTRHIRLVVQDIHEPHNVSACLRSAEAFGVLHAEVVCLTEKFSPSTVARGVDKWLEVKKWTSIPECAKSLKDQGYLLAAGFPDAASVPLPQVPVSQPIAVIFGNEHTGVSAEWLPFLDIKFTIPMGGMVESLNISVSAAVTMFELVQKAKAELPPQDFYLSAADQKTLLNTWSCRQLMSWEGELKRLREKT